MWIGSFVSDTRTYYMRLANADENNNSRVRITRYTYTLAMSCPQYKCCTNPQFAYKKNHLPVAISHDYTCYIRNTYSNNFSATISLTCKIMRRYTHTLTFAIWRNQLKYTEADIVYLCFVPSENNNNNNDRKNEFNLLYWVWARCCCRRRRRCSVCIFVFV